MSHFVAASLWALVMTIQWSNGQWETSIRYPYLSEQMCMWHARAIAEAAPENKIIIIDMACRPFPERRDIQEYRGRPDGN